MTVLVARSAAVLVAALITASPAPAAVGSSGSLTMDDGVTITYDLVLPEGTAPAGGWPGVIISGRDESLGEIFSARGYAVLLYDTRGHGASGGTADFAGHRDVADLRAIRAYLGDRPEISDSAIGTWGASYGGGLILNALVAGVPFAAADVAETWTDLYTAFWPQGIAKPLMAGGLMRESPVFEPFAFDAVRSRNLGGLRPLLAARSPLAGLRGVRTPVYLAQGRVDWLFDIAQATAAFSRLAGPKKLYVGTFGHVPSPGLAVSPDAGYVLDQGLAWFDRFLRGMPNGIESPKVELAAAGGARASVSWAGLPPTTTRSFGRSARVQTAFETWGGGTVEVAVKRLRAYPRLVAVVWAGRTVVTHGAIRPGAGRNVIRLASYCVFVPRGARLRVALGPAGGGDIAYAAIAGERTGSISLGRPRVKLSVLRQPVTGRGPPHEIRRPVESIVL